MTAEPSSRCIRARIDWAMPWWSPDTADGSKPRPRSRTNTMTTSASTSAYRETCVAPDHLAALTVASRAASSSARSRSVSGQSPTTTTWTVMPWSDST